MEKIRLGIVPCREGVKLPEFATPESACFDIRACLAPDMQITIYNPQREHGDSSSSGIIVKLKLTDAVIGIYPKERILIPTGMKLNIPEGYSLRLHPRSGLALKQGLGLSNSEGVIDSDYKEELMVCIINHGSEFETITDGDRICQAELVKNIPTVIEFDTELKNKDNLRSGGFGSTGIK